MSTKCQQYELYEAERDVTEGRKFANQKELQAFVDDLVQRDWWSEFYPMVRFVEAFALRGGTASVGGFDPHDGAGQIEMLPVHMNERTVLHELAHVLAAARGESKAHDPCFARIYLELVYRVMGYDVWHKLRTRFIEAGIDFDWTDAR